MGKSGVRKVSVFALLSPVTNCPWVSEDHSSLVLAGDQLSLII